MFTTQEKLEMKELVLKELHKLILHLGQDEKYSREKLKYILNYAHENLINSNRVKSLEKHLRELEKTEEKIKKISKKLSNKKNELLQKITQECLENILEKNPDRWMQLSEESKNLNTNSFKTWVSNLSGIEIQELQKALTSRSHV